MLYLLLKILHLLCACIVVGYLVYDVCVFSYYKHNRTQEEFLKLKREVLKPSVLLLGTSFLLLLGSGVGLFSFYVDFTNGVFSGIVGFFKEGFLQLSTALETFSFTTLDFRGILTLKICVVGLLFIFTPISFFYLLILKQPDPMRKFYHHLALVICFLALVLAKLLFV